MTAHEGDLEARLRGALSARALSVTADDLRPGVPPTAASGRRLPRLPWRWPRLLAGAALAGVAAVAAVAWLPGEEREAPAPNPPAATVPASPSPSPSSPSSVSESAEPASPEPQTTVGRDGVPKGIPTTPSGSPATPTSTSRATVPPRRGVDPSPPASFG